MKSSRPETKNYYGNPIGSLILLSVVTFIISIIIGFVIPAITEFVKQVLSYVGINLGATGSLILTTVLVLVVVLLPFISMMMCGILVIYGQSETKWFHCYFVITLIATLLFGAGYVCSYYNVDIFLADMSDFVIKTVDFIIVSIANIFVEEKWAFTTQAELDSALELKITFFAMAIAYMGMICWNLFYISDEGCPICKRAFMMKKIDTQVTGSYQRAEFQETEGHWEEDSHRIDTSVSVGSSTYTDTQYVTTEHYVQGQQKFDGVYEYTSFLTTYECECCRYRKTKTHTERKRVL